MPVFPQVLLLLLLLGLVIAQNLANETAQLPKPVLLANTGLPFRLPPFDDVTQVNNRVIFFIPSQPCGLLFLANGTFTHDPSSNEVSNGTMLLGGQYCWADVRLNLSVSAPGELFFFARRIINQTTQGIELFNTDGSTVTIVPFADPATYTSILDYPTDRPKRFANYIGLLLPVTVATQPVLDIFFIDLNLTYSSRAMAYHSDFDVPLQSMKPKLSAVSDHALWVLLESNAAPGSGSWYRCLTAPSGLLITGSTFTFTFPTASTHFFMTGGPYLVWMQNSGALDTQAILNILKESDTSLVPSIAQDAVLPGNFTWITLVGLSFQDRILAIDADQTTLQPVVYFAVNSSGVSQVVRTKLLTSLSTSFLSPPADGAFSLPNIGHRIIIYSGTTLLYFASVDSTLTTATFLADAANPSPFQPRSFQTVVGVGDPNTVYFIGSPAVNASRLYRINMTAIPWQVSRIADVNITSAELQVAAAQLFFMCVPPVVGYPTLCKWNESSNAMTLLANFTAKPSSFEGEVLQIFPTLPPSAFVVYRSDETNQQFLPALSILARPPTLVNDSSSMANVLGMYQSDTDNLADFIEQNCDQIALAPSSNATDLFGIMTDAVDQFCSAFNSGDPTKQVQSWAPLMTALESLAEYPELLQNRTRFQLFKIIRLVALNSTNSLDGAQQILVNITDKIFKIVSKDALLAAQVADFMRHYSKRLAFDTNQTATTCGSSLDLDSAVDLAVSTVKTSVQDLFQNGRSLRNVSFQLTSTATQKLSGSCVLSALVFYSRFPIAASHDSSVTKSANPDQPAVSLDLTDPSSGGDFFTETQDAEVITLRFKLNDTALHGKAPVCVYFNTTTQQWSAVGGRLVGPSRNGEVECAWKHLTDFSVLLPDSGNSSNKKVLLGAAIGASLGALVIVGVIVVAIVFRKKLSRVISFGHSSSSDKESINTL